MLRSSVPLRIVRWCGYSFTALAVSLFLYMFSITVAAAITADSANLRLWLVLTAFVSMTMMIGISTYASRRQAPEGYLVVGIMALVSASVSFVSLLPLLVF